MAPCHRPFKISASSCGRLGRQEFVGTTCEAGLGPPLVPEHALLFIGGALEPLEPEPRCGLASAAGVGGLAAVVITSPVPEAGFPYPQAGAELVEDDPGLFSEFAACCLVCWLVGVDTAAGQFPPVVGGVIGVASVNQQDAVARIKEQNARSQAQRRLCRWLCDGGHEPLVSSRVGRPAD